MQNDRKAPLWLVLLVAGVATAPMLLIALTAALGFPRFPGSNLLIWLVADVDSAAQFSRVVAYAGLWVSALLGAAYAAEIKALVPLNSAPRLGALAAIVGLYFVAHAILVYRLQNEAATTSLLNQFAPTMVGRADEGVAQIKQYAQWVTGSVLTLAAVVLGLPRLADNNSPARQEGPPNAATG